jgi:hypothetical protein
VSLLGAPTDRLTEAQGDSKLLSGFPLPIILKPETKEAKKACTLKLVQHFAVSLKNRTLRLICTFIFRKLFYYAAFGLKIIGHGNFDSNSDSLFYFGNFQWVIPPYF